MAKYDDMEQFERSYPQRLAAMGYAENGPTQYWKLFEWVVMILGMTQDLYFLPELEFSENLLFVVNVTKKVKILFFQFYHSWTKILLYKSHIW